MVNEAIGRAHDMTDDVYAKGHSQGPHLSQVLECVHLFARYNHVVTKKQQQN